MKNAESRLTSSVMSSLIGAFIFPRLQYILRNKLTLSNGSICHMGSDERGGGISLNNSASHPSGQLVSAYSHHHHRSFSNLYEYDVYFLHRCRWIVYSGQLVMLAWAPHNRTGCFFLC